jgi:hypothetical protein
VIAAVRVFAAAVGVKPWRRGRQPDDRIDGVSAEPLQVRPVSRADEAEFFDLDRWAFGYDEADADLDSARELLEWDRLAGVRLGDPPMLRGIHAALTQDLTVPGGSVRCGVSRGSPCIPRPAAGAC